MPVGFIDLLLLSKIYSVLTNWINSIVHLVCHKGELSDVLSACMYVSMVDSQETNGCILV